MKKPKIILEETDYYSPQRHLQGIKGCISCKTLEDLTYYWLLQRKGMVKKSTYSSYCYCVQAHILPLLGNVLLEELDETIIEVFLTDIQKQGLAETTIHSILVAFKSVVRFGIRCHLLKEELTCCCSTSYCRPESRILTIQDSAEMKEYLLQKNTVFSISILLCRGTGIRIGELCGLKWGDIDFASNSIKIRRTVSRIPNPDITDGQPKTVIYIRNPKSHTSAREIPIPGYLTEALLALRGKDELYILTGKETCTEPRNVQKKFKTILKHCGMQECNFHAMRHGFATACLENGMDCKTVSSILGHSSTHVTMDFYMHTSMHRKQVCVDAVQ